MKERLITLALAGGALFLFYALFAPKPVPQDQAPALPVSTETKADGYQALWRWLQGQQIPVVSLRERYDRLDRHTTASTGNVLLATLPQQLPTRVDEMESLDKWIERGNTLVVMAALDDTPKWALSADETFENTLQRVTRLKFSSGTEKTSSSNASTDESDSAATDDADDADTEESSAASSDSDEASSSSADTAHAATTMQQALDKLLKPERSTIEPHGTHPLLSDVHAITALSEFPASRWRAKSMDSAALLVLGTRTDSDLEEPNSQAVLWLKRQGAGQIIVCAFATPFNNQMLGETDNARLFANLLAWSRSATGAVLFDDVHQGLVSYYDANAFFSDPRLHRTLLWILLLWLLFVLGWQRFRPQLDEWQPVDVTTFIKVTGSFFAGSLTAASIGQRLFENFFNRIRRQIALSEDGQPVWEWLTAQASIANHELRDLQHLYAATQAGKRVDLMQLQNRLNSLMRHLA